jgi:hypothetical protein
MRTGHPADRLSALGSGTLAILGDLVVTLGAAWRLHLGEEEDGWPGS